MADIPWSERVVAPLSFFTEEDVLKTIPKWKWLSLSVGNTKLLAMNWVVTLIASCTLLLFVILSLAAGPQMIDAFQAKGQPWVTQNFTWLYIITQDVWVVFLIYICCTRYGNLRLGAENEKPRFNDLTWFAMLFCCGIAVGFFLFGVGEPVYYYRQPTYWKGWNFDYNLRKIQVNDDAQRANQSIFMCFFHWGVHGWIPYILMAVNVGIVSHKWGLPLTIRACFYPLVGNTVYSFVGDLIDSISMACTTFGVCTSLGLGVSQLSAGIVYMERYFQTNGVGSEATPTINFNQSGLVGLIWGITCIATLSVVTGLDKGLQYLSLLAMTICLVIMFFVLFADNTAFLLNVFVQNLGYYFQYIIQAGFDCEAFQQLSYEFDSGSNNLIWGSGPTNLIAKLKATPGLNTDFSSGDCGHQVNPCTTGEIASHFFASNELAGRGLMAFGVAATAYGAGANILAAFPAAKSIPCGSGWNATHTDAPLKAVLGTAAVLDAPVTWTGGFPSCPTTTFDASFSWGKCTKFAYSCTRFQALFDSTNRKFMDWWTIFYWGWWISWGPFVGLFIATISRGRTLRNVILGAFFLPCLFGFSWFAVFGGLGIKMERVAEFALNVKPDWQHGTIDCYAKGSDGLALYDGSGFPVSADAKNLEKIGYFMIACRPFVTQIYDVVCPYRVYAPFLMVLLFVGLFFYFITSSDSGSYIDDLLSASGLSKPPVLQKVYWGFTEGAVASALVGGAPGGNFSSILKGLRSVSICAGMPLTVLMCLMVPSTYRALKREFGDKDIITSKKFNSQLFDFCECYKPKNKNVPYWGQTGKCLTTTLIALVAPGLGIYKALNIEQLSSHKITKFVASGMVQILWLAWFIFQILDVGPDDSGSFSWVCWCFAILIIAYTRWQLRQVYNIWGSLLEDLWVSLTMPCFVVAQVQLQAENNGEGSPDYFTDLDAMLGEASSLKSVPEPQAAVQTASA
jgi:choline-glycine betaine transporter